MNRKKIFILFLCGVFLMVAGIILFIQSESFAGLLKSVAQKRLPSDLGIEGEFKELSVKLLPPGIVVHKPSLSLRERNFAGLPAGTKIEAESLDLTFQFFQLLTGEINVNAFALVGASVTLDLDEEFFSEYERRMKARQAPLLGRMRMPSFSLSWEKLVRFKFRSVSMLDSKMDVRLRRGGGSAPITVQAAVKELTVGRSTVDGFPAYDIAADFKNTLLKIGSIEQKLSQFQSSLEASAKGVMVRMLSAQEEDVNFHADGFVGGNVLNPAKMAANLNYLVRGPVPKLTSPKMLGAFVHLPKSARAGGLLAIEGHMQGDLLDLERTMESAFALKIEDPSYSGWKAKSLGVRGEWKRPMLTMTGASVDLGDGKISFSRVDYDSREELETISVRAFLEDADLRKLLGPALNAVYPLHMRLSGNMESRIDMRRGLRLSGKADLEIAEFSFDNQKPGQSKPMARLLAVPRLTAKSAFTLDEKGFQFSETEVRIKETKLRARGRVDENGVFDIDIQGPVKLAEVGKLSAFDIGGEGALRWTITGRKPNVIFAFDAQLRNAGYLNMNFGDVSGKIIYDDGAEKLTLQNMKATLHRSEFAANGTVDLGKTDEIDIDVRLPSGTIPDLANVFDSFIRKAVPWFPWELNGKVSGLVKVSGYTDTARLSVMGDLTMSNIEYLGEIFRGGTVHGGFRRGSYVAERLDLIKRNGRVTGNVVYGADDNLRISLQTHHATTVDVDRLAALGIPYLAPLDLTMDCSGRWGSLAGFLSAEIGAGVIKGYPIGSSKIRVDMANGRWRGKLSIFDAEFESAFDVGWKEGSDSQAEFKANSFRFHPLLIGLNTNLASDPQLFGDINGAAHFSFKTGSMSGLSGDFLLDSLQLRKKDYVFSLGGPVRFALKNGNYGFSTARFSSKSGESSRKVEVSGRVDSGAIAYDLAGGIHLKILEFLTPEIAASSGVADVAARIEGKADAPDFSGSLSVENGYLRLNAVEQPFEALKAQVLFKENGVFFKNIASKFAGGSIKASGKAAVHLTKVPDLDLQSEIENARVKVYPVTYARSSGKLFLKGAQLPYEVTGGIKVSEALIRENFNLSEGSRILRSSKFLPAGSGRVREHSLFNLSIDIAAERGILVKNDLFDAELKGQLRVINSLRTPRLLGAVDVLSGKLLFKDSAFNIQSGSLRFTNPTVIDPEFDFSANTELKGYKIQLVAGGLVSDYKFNLTSQPPLSQNDIVNLLTIGVTSSEYQSISRENRDAYSRDELYGLLFNQSGINRGLQEKFGLRLRVDQSQVAMPDNVFRAKAADTTETVAPKVVLQKQVTKRLSASVGSTVGVGDNQEKSANLEYDLHRNWSVLGIYEDQRGAQLKQSRTSLGADLKFKMRFK